MAEEYVIAEKQLFKDIADATREITGTNQTFKITSLGDELKKISDTSVGANKYFVTDENGEKKWEDRVIFKTTEKTIILPETEKPANSSSINFGDTPSNYIQQDSNYIVTLDGTEYACSPVDSDNFGLILGDENVVSKKENPAFPFCFIGFQEKNRSRLSFFIDTAKHIYSIKGEQIKYSTIPGDYIAGGLFKGEGDSSFRGRTSHCKGNNSQALGKGTVIGDGNSLFGLVNSIQANCSLVSGAQSIVNGDFSAALGTYLQANGDNQLVIGKYNLQETTSDYDYAFIVGNGRAGKTSNAFTIDWDGNIWGSGTLKLGGESYKDENAKEIALKEDVYAAETELLKKPLLAGKEWKLSNQKTGAFNTILYNNNIFVAFGYENNGIYYSEDGKNWTQSNITSGYFSGYFLNNLWFGRNNAYGAQTYYYSEDGKVWENINNLPHDILIFTYLNNLFFAESGDLGGLYYSQDGKSWNKIDTITSTVSEPFYHNNLYWCFENRVGFYSSPDGVVWTLVTQSTDMLSNVSKFFQLEGKVLYTNMSSIYTLTDGAWVKTEYEEGKGPTRLTCQVEDTTFGISAQNVFLINPKEKDWVPINLNNLIFYEVVEINGVFVTCCRSNTSPVQYSLWYSIDKGYTWKKVELEIDSTLTFYFANGTLIGQVGHSEIQTENTGLYFSYDGINWERTNITKGAMGNCAFGNNIWVSGGSHRLSNIKGLYYSEPWFSSTNDLKALEEKVVKTVGMITPDNEGNISPLLFLQYLPNLGDNVSNFNSFEKILSYIENMPSCICYAEFSNSPYVYCLQGYRIIQNSTDDSVISYVLNFGEKVAEVIIDISAQTVKRNKIKKNDIILIDENEGKWKLIVNTDGTLSTTAVSTTES